MRETDIERQTETDHMERERMGNYDLLGGGLQGLYCPK